MALGNTIKQFARSALGLGKPETPWVPKFQNIGAFYDELGAAAAEIRDPNSLYGHFHMNTAISQMASDIQSKGHAQYDALMRTNEYIVFGHRDSHGVPDEALPAAVKVIQAAESAPSDQLSEMVKEEARPKSLVERFMPAVLGKDKYESPFRDKTDFYKQLNRAADAMKAGHVENGEIMMQDTILHAIRAKQADGMPLKSALFAVNSELTNAVSKNERVPEQALDSLNTMGVNSGLLSKPDIKLTKVLTA